MFRALCRSSSGTSTLLAATGLHTLAETRPWCRLSGNCISLVIGTSHTTMHGSMNVKKKKKLYPTLALETDKYYMTSTKQANIESVTQIH